MRSPEQLIYRRGTPVYMAPEQGSASASGVDIRKVEVFSLGVILFRLIFKQYPFRPTSYEDSAARDPLFVDKFIDSNQNINNIKVSDSLRALLKGMLEFSNERRLSLDQVIASPWFIEMSKLLKSDR